MDANEEIVPFNGSADGARNRDSPRVCWRLHCGAWHGVLFHQ